MAAKMASALMTMAPTEREGRVGLGGTAPAYLAEAPRRSKGMVPGGGDFAWSLLREFLALFAPSRHDPSMLDRRTQRTQDPVDALTRLLDSHRERMGIRTLA